MSKLSKPGDAAVTPNLADLRTEYHQSALDEQSVAADPISQFQAWFQQVYAIGANEPSAMTLATVASDGQPSARVVLLKGLDGGGFAFYTNYESRKGNEMAGNDKAALVFFWPELERQVRAEGRIVRLSASNSDQYYASRPLPSRIGAWASPQSQVVRSRAVLEHRTQEFTVRYGSEPPRPPHWGGYQLLPVSVEFWQGRRSRLHDRICYCKTDTGWRIERLAP